MRALYHLSHYFPALGCASISVFLMWRYFTVDVITPSGVMLLTVWLLYPLGEILNTIVKLDILRHKILNLNLRIGKLKHEHITR